VKQEIQASRLVYKEQAAKAYQMRMNEARAGKQEYPLIRTFHKNPHSTNCVYSDMEEAQKWYGGAPSTPQHAVCMSVSTLLAH